MGATSGRTGGRDRCRRKSAAVESGEQVGGGEALDLVGGARKPAQGVTDAAWRQREVVAEGGEQQRVLAEWREIGRGWRRGRWSRGDGRRGDGGVGRRGGGVGWCGD